MNHYAVLTFNHANLKRPVNIIAGTISAFHESKTELVCNVIYTTGGIVPVSDSIDEIKAKLQALETGETNAGK